MRSHPHIHPSFKEVSPTLVTKSLTDTPSVANTQPYNPWRVTLSQKSKPAVANSYPHNFERVEPSQKSLVQHGGKLIPCIHTFPRTTALMQQQLLMHEEQRCHVNSPHNQQLHPGYGRSHWEAREASIEQVETFRRPSMSWWNVRRWTPTLSNPSPLRPTLSTMSVVEMGRTANDDIWRSNTLMCTPSVTIMTQTLKLNNQHTDVIFSKNLVNFGDELSCLLPNKKEGANSQ